MPKDAKRVMFITGKHFNCRCDAGGAFGVVWDYENSNMFRKLPFYGSRGQSKMQMPGSDRGRGPVFGHRALDVVFSDISPPSYHWYNAGVKNAC